MGAPLAPVKAHVSLLPHPWAHPPPSGRPTGLKVGGEVLPGPLWGAQGLKASVTQSYHPCCPSSAITTPASNPETQVSDEGP